MGSVRAQTFGDWELFVIDDGSTDDTASLFKDNDIRIHYVHQANAGVYAARNHGLSLAGGRYITFLDSDDEWLPHYLELTVSFLDASPQEQYVITELWHDHGHGEPLRIHRDAVRAFASLAPRVGRNMLRLPSGETDDYLRVYETRERLGEWGKAIAEFTGHRDAWLYRGHIFRHFRWGYLGWLPTTVIRREALMDLAPFNDKLKTTDDYRFLAELSRHYPTNMIAIPCAIKHEIGRNDEPLAEDHLATGGSGYRFAITRLKLFDDLFLPEGSFDPETRRIRALHECYAGQVALLAGKRREALEHFRGAWRANHGMWDAALHYLYLWLIPVPAVASRLYLWARRVTRRITALRRRLGRPLRAAAS